MTDINKAVPDKLQRFITNEFWGIVKEGKNDKQRKKLKRIYGTNLYTYLTKCMTGLIGWNLFMILSKRLGFEITISLQSKFDRENKIEYKLK